MYRDGITQVPTLNDDEVVLVENQGEPLPAGDGYGPGKRLCLSVRRLYQLTKSEDSLISNVAEKLVMSVKSNPNRLLHDEIQEILRPLGIQMIMEPRQLIYYTSSGMVMVEWRGETRTMNDTIRWALIAPPNHPRILTEVTDFLKEHPKKVNRIRSEIEMEGLKLASAPEDH